MDDFIFIIVGYLITVIVIIALIVWGISSLIMRSKKKRGLIQEHKLSRSSADAISQLYFVLGLFFLGMSLIAINRIFSNILEWQTVLLLTTLIGLAVTYYLKIVYPLVVILLSFFIWWGVQSFQWLNGAALDANNNQTFAIISGMLFISLLYYIIGRIHGSLKNAPRPSYTYLAISLLSATGLLFFLSTKYGLYVLEQSLSGTTVFASWQVSTLVILLFVAIAVGIIYALQKKIVHPGEAIALIIVTVLFALLTVMPEMDLFADGSRNYFRLSNPLTTAGLLWAFILNILIFLELLGIIFLGYIRREGWYINFGAFFLFILVFVKYFDYFFTFLDKSLFFIGAGVIFFLVGWFMERGRRAVLATVKKDTI